MNYIGSEQYPNTRGNTALLGSIGFIGRQESLRSYGKTNDASRIIGEACLVLVGQKNPHKAKRLFGKVKAAIPDTTNRPPVYQSKIKHLGMFANMLNLHNQPTTIEQLRADYHENTVKSLRKIDRLTKRAIGRNETGYAAGAYIGYRNELTTLAVMTRYCHPSLMATLALTHRDEGEVKKDNYDILLTDATPGIDRAVGYKLQAKTGCIGVCDEPKKQESPTSYARDIVLVSGHCDLRLPGDAHSGDQVRDMLYREVEGTASYQDMIRLDEVTDHLMLGVIDDSRRRGTLDIY